MMYLAYVGIAVIAVGASLYMAQRARQQHAGTTAALAGEVEQVHRYAAEIGQSSPTCTIAYESTKRTPIVVGFTEQRVLVKPFGDKVHEFQYDDEGEHLRSAEKLKQNRGFFEWKFDDEVYPGQRIYAPLVKSNGGVFANQVWYFFPQIDGFPQQKENMHKFAHAFFFQWFW